jgi:hypothetical protein
MNNKKEKFMIFLIEIKNDIFISYLKLSES